MSPPKKKKVIVAIYMCLFLVFIIAIVVPLKMFDLHLTNTLQNLPYWGASKQHVAMELMGSPSYNTKSQALAGNHLHLESWHGYQEVMYRKKVVPESITFSFFLEDNSWIALIFNRPRTYAYEKEDYCALRLSTMKEKPSALLQVDPLGKFTGREPIDTSGKVKTDSWNTCTVTWKDYDYGIEVLVNGESLGTFDGNYKDDQYIGFRGGVNIALVDDVSITEISGCRHYSSFSWRDSLKRNQIIFDSISIFFKIVFLVILALAISLLFTRNLRTSAALVLAGCFTATLIIWPCALYRITVLAPRYPLESEMMRKSENLLIEKGIEVMKDKIRQVYPEDYQFPENTVMVVGTSQAWGSGATLREHSWVKSLEAIMNEGDRPQQVLCINSALCGANSKMLYQLYEEFLSQYPHKLLLIVLGCNDHDEEEFKENLARFMSLARKKQIKSALVVEALSYEELPGGTGMSSIMKFIADEYDVPLFNMHQAVAEYQDAGFFWWDIVHPTSFGHKCIAEVLAPFVSACLEIK